MRSTKNKKTICSICHKNNGWISIHSRKWMCHRCEPLTPRTVAAEANLIGWGDTSCSYSSAALEFSLQLEDVFRRKGSFIAPPSGPINRDWKDWISDPRRLCATPLGRYFVCRIGMLVDRCPKPSEEVILKETVKLIFGVETAEKILNGWGSSLEEVVFFDFLVTGSFKRFYNENQNKVCELWAKELNLDVKKWNKKITSAIKQLKKISVSLEPPPHFQKRSFYGPKEILLTAIQNLSQCTFAGPLSPQESLPQFCKNPTIWKEVVFGVIKILRARNIPIEKDPDSKTIQCSINLVNFILCNFFPEEYLPSTYPSSLRKTYNRINKSFTS